MVIPAGRDIAVIAIVVLLVSLAVYMGRSGYDEPSGWTRHITGPSQFLNDVTTGIEGGIYITGYAAGDHDLDGHAFRGIGAGDAYLARFNPDSTCSWVVTATSSGWNGGRGLAPAPGGGVFWAGRIEGETDLGGIALKGAGGNDAFVAHVGPDGSVRWALSFGGPGTEWANAVAAAKDGGCLVAGQFQSVVNTTLGPIEAEGPGDFFVARIGPEGDLRWIVSGGGPGPDAGYGVTVDAAGRIYAVGTFAGTFRIAGSGIRSSAPTSGFIACLNDDGTVNWIEGDDPEASTAWSLDKIVSDRSGRIVAVGSFGGAIRFGDASVQSNGDADLLVLEVDPDSGVTGATSLGGPGRDGLAGFGQSVDAVILPGGRLAVATSFSDSVAVGPHLLRCAGFQDILIVEFDRAGRPVRPIALGEEAFEGFVGVARRGEALVITGNSSSGSLMVGGNRYAKQGSFMDGFLWVLPWGDH